MKTETFSRNESSVMCAHVVVCISNTLRYQLIARSTRNDDADKRGLRLNYCGEMRCIR